MHKHETDTFHAFILIMNSPRIRFSLRFLQLNAPCRKGNSASPPSPEAFRHSQCLTLSNTRTGTHGSTRAGSDPRVNSSCGGNNRASRFIQTLERQQRQPPQFRARQTWLTGRPGQSGASKRAAVSQREAVIGASAALIPLREAAVGVSGHVKF